MGLVEHLTSPQFTDKDGCATNKNPLDRIVRLTAPGAPRWQGYLFYGALIALGVALLLLTGSVGWPVLLAVVGAWGMVEVWWGRPLLPWWRPKRDE